MDTAYVINTKASCQDLGSTPAQEYDFSHKNGNSYHAILSYLDVKTWADCRLLSSCDCDTRIKDCANIFREIPLRVRKALCIDFQSRGP